MDHIWACASEFRGLLIVSRAETLSRVQGFLRCNCWPRSLIEKGQLCGALVRASVPFLSLTLLWGQPGFLSALASATQPFKTVLILCTTVSSF